jgi:pheromone shutdown protein TraB
MIAVELDLARFEALKKVAKDPSVDDVLELKNSNQLLIQWILSYLQRRIGLDVGVEPGAEMKAAIAEAESRRIPLSLVDRDIRLTLHEERSMSLSCGEKYGSKVPAQEAYTRPGGDLGDALPDEGTG